MAPPAAGSWNGKVMSAFSQNRRRILSLWLPRLPIDRIKRAKAFSSEVGTGSREENASKKIIKTLSSEAVTRPREDNASSLVQAFDEAGIVVAKQNNMLRIFALNDAAAQFGLDIGLPLANARAICPEVKVYDADEAADAKTLGSIADWCDGFTPLVALDPPHGLFLDITGCAHLFGGEAAMMQLVCGVLTAQGFTVSAAIAGTAVCARTLTRYVHGRIVRDGEEADVVRPLPLSALGADIAVVAGLRRAGLKTIGDVADRTRHEITARFGAGFTALLEQALGQSDAPISPRKPPPDYIVEKRFAEPVATAIVSTARPARRMDRIAAKVPSVITT